MLKHLFSPGLLKKVQMQGGTTHLAMGTRRANADGSFSAACEDTP
jgi:hypothetical protein